MRAIKFRAWDKVCKEMFYNSELANGDIMVIHLDGRIELSDDDTYKPDDFILMQYTGLKDKNDKEIYEGDIIRHDWGLNKITFEDYSFTAEQILTFDGKYNCNLYLSDIGSDCEVTGNIYENPELLK